jgi:PAS domain-containing protein
LGVDYENDLQEGGWLMKTTLHTQFAPAERASQDSLNASIKQFDQDEHCRALVDAVPIILLVLNQQRQVVFFNKVLRKNFEADDKSVIFGQRPGELLGCLHADETSGGCGTTEFCRTCGAANAILSSLQGKNDVQVCRILLKNGEALDLRVWATPYKSIDQTYSIFSIVDISHEQRRRVLERIFFHDVLNTAGGLRGFTELMMEAKPDELDDLRDTVYEISEELIDEIQAQRDLATAESGELQIKISPVRALELLEDLKALYSNHEVSKGIQIEMENVEDLEILTDRVQLRRVLGNMIKNALEASKPGEKVELGGELIVEGYRFWVRNQGWIPRDIQLQLFQRSFSTKGGNRGLGTYSIKLLGEKFLGGKVDFDSSPEEGTVFRFLLPIENKER